MGIFNFNKSYIGVDLGTSAIKMVELQNKAGRAMLLTYGYVEQPTDIIRASSTETEQKIINIIKGIYKKSRMSSKRVVAALPSFSVFNSIINLPLMGKKDLAQAIKWEARKFIPLPIEDMTLDWKIIPERKVKKSIISIKKSQEAKATTSNSLPTAQKSLSSQPNALSNHAAEAHKQPGADKQTTLNQKLKKDAYQSAGQPADKLLDSSSKATTSALSLNKLLDKSRNLFHKKQQSAQDKKSSKQNIKILLTAAPKNLVEKYIRIFKAADLELLRLETEAFALERSLSGGDWAPIMIIDIGAISSDISVIDNNIPILTRSIDVGGTAITKSVMTSLNVDLARAEQFKRDIGFSASGPGDLPEIIKNTINPIVNEVKYCLDIYLSQGNQHSLEKIILTGGSAFLPELVNYLSKLLDVKVIIGDPWSRVVYPLELKPALTELGPRFSVAVGLAMREI